MVVAAPAAAPPGLSDVGIWLPTIVLFPDVPVGDSSENFPLQKPVFWHRLSKKDAHPVPVPFSCALSADVDPVARATANIASVMPMTTVRLWERMDMCVFGKMFNQKNVHMGMPQSSPQGLGFSFRHCANVCSLASSR